MGIRWDRETKWFVAALIAGAGADRKFWDESERGAWAGLRQAGLVTLDEQLLPELYENAIAQGILTVHMTVKVDQVLQEPALAVYGATVHGATSGAVPISPPLRTAVAYGLALGRMTLAHERSGDYVVVAK